VFVFDPVAKLPSAKINEPTVTSERAALAPDLLYVVALDTTTTWVAPPGPEIVMVSPFTAVTFPIALGWTMSMLAAVVEPAAMGVMWTSSFTARSLSAAVDRSLVTEVEDVIANVVAVPE
jgi:hypothetical protein